MLTCFKAESDILRIDELRIGDTGLVDQFLDLCAVWKEGVMFFTAPFYDQTFVESLANHLPFRSTCFEVIVKDEATAGEFLRALHKHKCRSAEIYICKKLHAKVYIFESENQDLAAVIGSHNATKAGTKKNLEIGVFIGAKAKSEKWSAVLDLREFLKKKARFFGSAPLRTTI